MNENLIFDVGMHTGRDTDFYLRKGFSVVAIEANPRLVERAAREFSSVIESGQLIIHQVAISDHEGEVEFFVNDDKDDWGTIFEERGTQALVAVKPTPITLPCTTFASILRDHEVPYYLKIDIEGADMLCLKALRENRDRPRYISIEAGMNSDDGTFEELALLSELGYKDFKVVNQALNARVRCPHPPLEGKYVDVRFDATCSGPFGEEAPGKWMSLEEATRECRIIERNRKRFGHSGPLRGTIWHRLHRLVTREPVGWYDIHAR